MTFSDFRKVLGSTLVSGAVLLVATAPVAGPKLALAQAAARQNVAARNSASEARPHII